MKEKFQKTGQFISNVMISNIGIFIAYGLFMAIFGEYGWFPMKEFKGIEEMIRIALIPFMIALTGGYRLYGRRGAVTAVIAIVGAVAYRDDFSMVFAALFMGPLAAFTIQKSDFFLEKKILPYVKPCQQL